MSPRHHFLGEDIFVTDSAENFTIDVDCID